MKVRIGSKNPTKIHACEAVFKEYTVEGISVPSGVSPQPKTDEETRRGAINRAIAAFNLRETDIGVGLEGGVMLLNGSLYLTNWGALAVSHDEIYTAAGARIALPSAFLPELKQGKELGDIMEEYAQKENIRSNEGAIGIFTNDQIDRSTMFTHVTQILRGQLEYWSKI
ncbi:DUF84 family protein [Oceanobacillus alkalisoli]|uniref:DUF84 family protein n=1 Tax=Oceanobacillus alkalisoli TaxID=2925113 RepID=UPI001EE3BE93|nr:DUF84 family protein [Oceanobacillus alkalisoli]MCG5103845.1 DUF84 family protein [Oceanobacillus alkalisoli]